MKKDKTDNYLAKGQMIFVQTKDGLKECRYDRNYYINKYKNRLGVHTEDYINTIYNSKYNCTIYKLISGMKFLNMVLENYFTDDDGAICEIFADGFKTNLGLFTDNLFSGGGCLLDENAWRNICDRYNIEVNWVNK